MAGLLPLPKFTVSDSNGDPAVGWKVHTYIAGTTTNKATYTDQAEGTPNANPVILDSRGEADIWFNGSYKIVIKDSDDTTIYTVDNYNSVLTVDSSGNLTIGGTLNGATLGTNPTTQIFTSGSGTYTKPATATWIRVRLVGAGGGGGGSGNAAAPTNGTTGGQSTFDVYTGSGGIGGNNSLTGGFVGAAGGAASGGDINIPGCAGQSAVGNTSPALYQAHGTNGGDSVLGGGGAGGANGAGSTGVAGGNYGGGGGGVGAGTSSYASSGGGGGGYVEHIIPNPVATYAYAVGAGGSGGTAGTDGGIGGAGASGVVIVEEFYS